jgi:hypothetical protein
MVIAVLRTNRGKPLIINEGYKYSSNGKLQMELGFTRFVQTEDRGKRELSPVRILTRIWLF